MTHIPSRGLLAALYVNHRLAEIQGTPSPSLDEIYREFGLGIDKIIEDSQPPTDLDRLWEKE